MNTGAPSKDAPVSSSASSAEASDAGAPAGPPPSLLQLFVIFLFIGLTSFGGSVAAYIQKVVVERKQWMTDKEFLTGYTLSVFLPGANTPNLAVYIGRHLRGGAGAVVAFVAVVFPPAALVTVVGAILLTKDTPPHIANALEGFGAAAVGLIAATAFNLGRKAKMGLEGLFIVAAAMALVAGLHVSIIIALLVLTPSSIGLQYWRQRRG